MLGIGTENTAKAEPVATVIAIARQGFNLVA
jgi:hypothetical protein